MRSRALRFPLFAASILLTIYGLFHLIPKQGKELLPLEYFVFSDDSYRLRCIAREGKESHENLEAAMRANQCSAGSNGGFFHRKKEGQTPVGLLIDDGVIYGDECYRSAITSATIFSEGDNIKIVPSSKFNPHLNPPPQNALQTGPFLVGDYLAREELKDSPNQTATRRTFIGTDGMGRWVLGYCELATLYQLAETLADPMAFPGFRLKTAINLDGGPSSAFWKKTERQKIYIPEQGKVANYLGIVPK